jgi:hypothetical protein
MQTIILNPSEIEVLDRQDPMTERDGGFQKLLVDVQYSIDRKTGALVLSDEHEEKIPRYAFDYKNGGWGQISAGNWTCTFLFWYELGFDNGSNPRGGWAGAVSLLCARSTPR